MKERPSTTKSLTRHFKSSMLYIKSATLGDSSWDGSTILEDLLETLRRGLRMIGVISLEDFL